MSDKLRAEIRFECEQLDELLRTYGRLLVRGSAAIPDEIETAAAGALLHSFYNGVENIFKRVVVAGGGELPRGDCWHRDLLERMISPASGVPVISATLGDRLKPYLHFRHLFRSAYVLVLRWEKMAPLLEDLQSTFEQLKSELEEHLRLPTGEQPGAA